MIVKLLTEHHLECQSLKGGCRGSSESTHVKIPHCWKSHAACVLTCMVRVQSHPSVIEYKFTCLAELGYNPF